MFSELPWEERRPGKVILLCAKLEMWVDSEVPRPPPPARVRGAEAQAPWLRGGERGLGEDVPRAAFLLKSNQSQI